MGSHAWALVSGSRPDLGLRLGPLTQALPSF